MRRRRDGWSAGSSTGCASQPSPSARVPQRETCSLGINASIGRPVTADTALRRFGWMPRLPATQWRTAEGWTPAASLYVPADRFPRFIAGEHGARQKVVGMEEPATYLFSADRVLRLERALAVENQRDHRVAQAQQFRRLALRPGPGNEVSKGGHRLSFAGRQAGSYA